MSAPVQHLPWTWSLCGVWACAQACAEVWLLLVVQPSSAGVCNCCATPIAVRHALGWGTGPEEFVVSSHLQYALWTGTNSVWASSFIAILQGTKLWCACLVWLASQWRLVFVFLSSSSSFPYPALVFLLAVQCWSASCWQTSAGL